MGTPLDAKVRALTPYSANMVYRKRFPAASSRAPLLMLVCVTLFVFMKATPWQAIDDAQYGVRMPLMQSNAARLAFFIQVSNATVPQLPRLLSAIWHPDNVYAVHFDLRVCKKAASDAVAQANLSHPAPSNIHIMKPDVVNYRGISMLLNTIAAMQFLLDVDPSWRYFINLSASDYPLLTPRLLRELLAHEGPALNFFSFTSPENARAMLVRRMEQFHVDDALSLEKNSGQVRTIRARNPLVDKMGFVPSYAEAWMITSRQFCTFVVSSSVARKTLLTFAYTLSSPEHYFATLVRNDANFNSTVVPHSMRIVLWNYKGRQSGQHPLLLDELYEQDREFGNTITNAPVFFARKFKYANSALKDLIDDRRADLQHEELIRKHFTHRTDVALQKIRAAESLGNKHEHSSV